MSGLRFRGIRSGMPPPVRGVGIPRGAGTARSARLHYVPAPAIRRAATGEFFPMGPSDSVRQAIGSPRESAASSAFAGRARLLPNRYGWAAEAPAEPQGPGGRSRIRYSPSAIRRSTTARRRRQAMRRRLHTSGRIGYDQAPDRRLGVAARASVRHPRPCATGLGPGGGASVGAPHQTHSV